MSDVDEPHALAKLVRDQQELNGWSGRELSRRAEARGHERGAGKSTINDIAASKPVLTIVPAQIRMLADVLELPVAEVLAAALETVGLEAQYRPEAWTAEAGIRADPTLSADTKTTLLDFIESARKRPRPGIPQRRRRTQP